MNKLLNLFNKETYLTGINLACCANAIIILLLILASFVATQITAIGFFILVMYNTKSLSDDIYLSILSLSIKRDINKIIIGRLFTSFSILVAICIYGLYVFDMLPIRPMASNPLPIFIFFASAIFISPTVKYVIFLLLHRKKMNISKDSEYELISSIPKVKLLLINLAYFFVPPFIATSAIHYLVNL